MNYAIQTHQLTRDFGSLRAVDRLTLEVPAGQIFGLLGPNGAGKTTTIRLLLGLLPPTSGQVRVLGMDPLQQGEAVRSRCGALLEHSGLYERLSAEDNLDLYARIWRMDAASRKKRIRELLEGLGLWERRKETVAEWSRGMKQKLAIARVLLHRPPLIFLDEPTAGLDVPTAAALREDLLRMTAQEGTTIFLTTHNLSEAEKLCAQVAVIRDGQLLAVGSPVELRTRAGQPRLQVFGRGLNERALTVLQSQPGVGGVKFLNDHLEIALKEPAETAALVKLLVEQGAEIEEVRKSTASLEEAFLSLLEENHVH
ncbi:ABC-type multidrug transport system, ATPase component [Bellilinea caldifistulae]|uniref:ABC transporter n=1 Tax=Bellilinea caldifistulae TaxID=360411 RepID=A0A0P6Y305_9CHLR|nr:ABC transporter ATP-binding protein [Bellilinea caldifistulae]KPL79288.1 ABC transporter [Bellilinea caldifistulae]GAP09089.1 ABC-type multidrug transport system, ATPase component [Bellilinea caldifistulae]